MLTAKRYHRAFSYLITHRWALGPARQSYKDVTCRLQAGKMQAFLWLGQAANLGLWGRVEAGRMLSAQCNLAVLYLIMPRRFSPLS